MKKIILTLMFIFCLCLSACGSDSGDDSTLKQSTKESAQTKGDTKESTKDSLEEKETTAFIPSNSTSLMDFLTRAEDNGYLITDPSNNNGIVTCIAESATRQFSVEYHTQNNHVSKVSIYGIESDTSLDTEFMTCVDVMAKALNTSLTSETILNGVKQVISTPGTSIILDETQFSYTTLGHIIHVDIAY